MSKSSTLSRALDWTTDQGGNNIHVNNLTPITLTTVQTAANQSAQLALTTEAGDIVVRTDEKKTYCHNGGTASNMNDFTELQSPTDAVTSVSGATGVVADSDIDHDSLANFAANEHFVQSAITSVGTLTSLELSGNIDLADDTSIGISDTEERIEFDGAGDISVLDAKFGIGTNAPATKFHIADNYPDWSSKLVNTHSGGYGFVVSAGGASTTSMLAVDYNEANTLFELKGNGTTYLKGNVGIGTSSPSSPLGISKFLEIEHADNASLVLSETGTGDKWEKAHATSEFRFYYHDGSNGDYRMVINALGNVGIGDATPEDAKLKVVNSVDGDMAGKFEQTAAQDCLGIFQTGAGTAMYISSASSGGTGLWINQATNNPSIAVTDGSNTSPAYSFHGDMDTGMYRQGDNLLSFATAGNERMRIDNNGHVGIGPSAPDSEMLEVYNTVANTYGITVFNGASANYAAINLDADGAGDGIEINQSGAGKSVNIINSTGGEGLKITHSASAVALNVASSSSGQWAATLANSNSSGHGVYIEGGSGSGETALQVDNTGGTNLLKIKSDSVFTINASSWGNSSDRRLKENIEYISASGTDLINSLKPCKFDMIEGENNQYGFIAQDVEPVLPEAVNVYDEETGMLSLKSGYIVPWLVKALQEANARISALENA